MVRFRRADIPAFFIAAILIGVSLYFLFKYPRQSPSGFGPEWQFTPPGRGSSEFCIKKPPSDSAKQQ
jgi:hypothetical protein